MGDIQLKEDFDELDIKSLFRNPRIIEGPKAPSDADRDAVGTHKPHGSLVEMMKKHGYTPPSERQGPEQQESDYSVVSNPPRTFQYTQKQYYAPQINVEQYKQSIGELLSIIGDHMTYNQWMNHPAISQAINLLQ